MPAPGSGREPRPAKLWSRARKARLHLAPGELGQGRGGVRGSSLNQDQPQARRGASGSQNLARWAPDALGWKPWGCLLAGPSRMT